MNYRFITREELEQLRRQRQREQQIHAERRMGWDPRREDCIEGEFRVVAVRNA